jgi:hypothetical protein
MHNDYYFFIKLSIEKKKLKTKKNSKIYDSIKHNVLYFYGDLPIDGCSWTIKR